MTARRKTKRKKRPRFRVLSIDGGGIRGIIPGQLLVALEEKLQEASGKPNARIADFFDLIAGTSTGGILACVYLTPREKTKSNRRPRPRYSASEAVGLYLERGDEVFDVSLLHKIRSAGGLVDEKYPAGGLEKLLDDTFGNLYLRDLLKPCVITAYDIRRRRTHFFKQHNATARSKDYLVRDVCRATAAAPTYFEVAKIQSRARTSYPLIDGSVFANNPTLCAYAEARTYGWKPTALEMIILSLGTGRVKTGYEYSVAKDWGKIGWIAPMIDIMMSGAAESVDYQLRQIYEAVARPDQYVRIAPDLLGASPEMGDASAGNIDALREAGTAAARKHEEKLDHVVQLLTHP